MRLRLKINHETFNLPIQVFTLNVNLVIFRKESCSFFLFSKNKYIFCWGPELPFWFIHPLLLNIINDGLFLLMKFLLSKNNPCPLLTLRMRARPVRAKTNPTYSTTEYMEFCDSYLSVNNHKRTLQSLYNCQGILKSVNNVIILGA